MSKVADSHPVRIKSTICSARPSTEVFAPRARAMPLTIVDLPAPFGPRITAFLEINFSIQSCMAYIFFKIF